MANEIDKELLRTMFWAEVFGMSFFAECMNMRDTSEAHVWTILYEMEERTAHHIRPYLSSTDDLVRRQHETQKGIAKARTWSHLPWKDLVDEMIDWVTPYQQSYESARSKGPIFALVADHETALYHFLRAEQQHDEDSISILRDFLTRYPLPSSD